MPLGPAELPPVPPEVLLSVVVLEAPPESVLVVVSVLVDAAVLDVPAALPPDALVALVVVLPFELWPPLPVAVAMELLPPADEASDEELLDIGALPFELVLSVVCSSDGLPPALQAHTRTHAIGLCRTQLMRVNVAPQRTHRKQALIERAEHILSPSRENREHCGRGRCVRLERLALKFFWSVP